MKNYCLLFLMLLFCTSFYLKNENWGFGGHQRLNEMAVYTLPAEMMPLFKDNIEYLREHANDPDKRRYTMPEEGIRHYIDMDSNPFLPEDFTEALCYYTQLLLIDTTQNDTLPFISLKGIRHKGRDFYLKSEGIKTIFGRDSIVLADSLYRNFVFRNLVQGGHETTTFIALDSLKVLFSLEGLEISAKYHQCLALDKLSPDGILPYHLQRVQKQLTEAFVEKKKDRILKLAADLGHYVADAHVPLHTTENYDGQLTGQKGIHAFWETRLPDLFADAEYDYVVGQAEYKENTRKWFWEIVRHSFSLMPRTLATEKELRAEFDKEKQYCLETDKSGKKMLKTECPEYARAYHEKLNGMVEAQFRAAIHAIGTAWQTAWVDAGQPDLSKF